MCVARKILLTLMALMSFFTWAKPVRPLTLQGKLSLDLVPKLSGVFIATRGFLFDGCKVLSFDIGSISTYKTKWIESKAAIDESTGQYKLSFDLGYGANSHCRYRPLGFSLELILKGEVNRSYMAEVGLAFEAQTLDRYLDLRKTSKVTCNRFSKNGEVGDEGEFIRCSLNAVDYSNILGVSLVDYQNKNAELNYNLDLVLE